MSSEPAASIIIATYNRPYVLRYSIASVLQSDFSDWELIVVGDGCTDETAEIVRTFTDPRIRFINLPDNSGGQSAPNNAGLALARGRYIFFLNQDDLYFPDHLRRSVEFMERERAEIAWSPVLLLHRSGSETGPADPNRDVVWLDGGVPAGSFDPEAFIIASSWVVERKACFAVGKWRSEQTTRLSPSQEWLFRAYRQGRRLAYHRHASVLCIHAGTRRLSYAARRSPEHERAWTWIAQGNEARAALLQCAAIEQAGALLSHKKLLKRFLAQGRRAKLRALAVAALRHLGFHPVAAERFLEGQRKGDWIAGIRRFTGEAPDLPRDETLYLGSGLADPFIGAGWHGAEGSGRWSAGRHADILFNLAAGGPEDWVLELSGRPLQSPQTVEFSVNNRPILRQIFDESETAVRLPMRGSGTFWLTIRVETAATPQAMTGSSDTRTLGFWLSWLRIVADEGPKTRSVLGR